MIELRLPHLDLLASYLAFIQEMRDKGETIWSRIIPQANESSEDFIARLLGEQILLSPGLVPETNYWATKNKTVVGRIALRHVIDKNLQEFGGHIGYETRPSFRNQGIAKEMLKQILQTPQAQEIKNLLLTCSPDNIASNKTIVANGGVLEKTVYVERIQRKTNYYWIKI